MNDIKIFKLSWHYTIVIVPLILIVATVASYGILEDIFVHNIIFLKRLIAPPVTLYLWYKCLTVPFKVKVLENKRIIAQSLTKRIRISIKDVEKIKHHFFSSKVYYKGGTFQITNLMNNFPQFVSAISSNNPDIITEKFK